MSSTGDHETQPVLSRKRVDWSLLRRRGCFHLPLIWLFHSVSDHTFRSPSPISSHLISSTSPLHCFQLPHPRWLARITPSRNGFATGSSPIDWLLTALVGLDQFDKGPTFIIKRDHCIEPIWRHKPPRRSECRELIDHSIEDVAIPSRMEWHDRPSSRVSTMVIALVFFVSQGGKAS
jgi:hypothetical protein